jgi:hypothetical protein
VRGWLPRYGIETRPEVDTDTVTVEAVVEFVIVYVATHAAMTIRSSTRLNPLVRPPLTGRPRGMIDEEGARDSCWRVLPRLSLRLREVVQ